MDVERLRRQKEASVYVQAAIRAYRVRSTLREGLLPQIQALEGSVQGEHAVEYVQMSTSSLGIKIVPRGGTAAARLGVVVSEKDIRIVPEAIKPGMLLEAIGTAAMGEQPFEAVIAAMKAAPRPVTIRFVATMEHRVLELLENQFLAADRDHSGRLGPAELAGVLETVCQAVGLPSPAHQLEECIAGALHHHDATHQGSLAFTEFVSLLCTEQRCGLPLTAPQRAKVRELAHVLQAKLNLRHHRARTAPAVQGVVRGHSIRAMRLRASAEHCAATRVQALFRGSAVLKETRHTRERRRHQAAMQLQAAMLKSGLGPSSEPKILVGPSFFM